MVTDPKFHLSFHLIYYLQYYLVLSIVTFFPPCSNTKDQLKKSRSKKAAWFPTPSQLGVISGQSEVGITSQARRVISGQSQEGTPLPGGLYQGETKRA